MKHFKGIIMSEYTSQLTILHDFPKIFSMIRPTKPTASAGCDTTLFFLCKKLTFQIKIYSQTRVSCSIFSKFFRGNIYAPQTPSN